MRKFQNLSEFMEACLRECSEMSVSSSHNLHCSISEIDNTHSMYTNNVKHDLDSGIADKESRSGISRERIQELFADMLNNKNQEGIIYKWDLIMGNEFDSEPLLKCQVKVNRDLKIDLTIESLQKIHWSIIPKFMLHGIKFLTWIWINISTDIIGNLELQDTIVRLNNIQIQEDETIDIKSYISDLL